MPTRSSLGLLAVLAFGSIAQTSAQNLALLRDPTVAALENEGNVYAARRALSHLPQGCSDLALLKRRAALEDNFGGSATSSYMALLEALQKQSAPQSEVVAVCRRAVLASIREEQFPAAQVFAAKLAAAGDRSALALLAEQAPPAASVLTVPGGAAAFHFLLLGHAKSEAGDSVLDSARALANLPPPAASPEAKAEWQQIDARIHAYFQAVAALSALGRRQPGKVEISLSVADKPSKQRTEKVLEILGLKIHAGKEGVTVRANEGKGQSKKQEVLAALAIDEQSMQEALAQGKTYTLDIPYDAVPVFPSEDLWRAAFFDKDKFPGGLLEAMAADIRLPRLYVALNSMDRNAAQAWLAAGSLRSLAERDSNPLWLYSACLALNGRAAEVPGGDSALPVWESIVGAAPSNAVAFYQSLMHKDEGRLIAFFYSLSQLDIEHQRFFTGSAPRLKRFYELFRNSADMRRGAEVRLGEGTFVQFLHELPLNDDLSVAFPGSPEVWMVAKGLKNSESSMGKLARKIKRSAAPEDEDQILIRLASTDYKNDGRVRSELSNLIVVSWIDAQRAEPMSPEAALVLAQGYSTHPGLYPYFASLGNLAAPDYQKLLALDSKCEGVPPALANLRLGELHGFLALAVAARESGLPENEFLALFRQSLDRFAAATDSASWVTASLAFIEDLSRPNSSADAAVRQILLAGAAPQRAASFDRILSIQNAPSLDGLLSIHRALAKPTAASLAEIQRALQALVIMPLPKAWRLDGDRKKAFELYDSAQAMRVLARLQKHKDPKLAAELRAELEPWVELATVGRIYARYLDTSDLLASDDPTLLRKHEFANIGPRTSKARWFEAAALMTSSHDAGSYFTGGLAEFSVAAAEARALGNHLAPGGGESFATALLASVRATDWRALNPNALASFGATVRLAREWIVESATAPAMFAELANASRGILSLTRRKALLEGVERRAWPQVWQSVSVSDLHFIGDELAEHAPKPLWSAPQLQAMHAAASHAAEADMLGSVAPELSGCARPRLRRYEPYEEYQRQVAAQPLAQRLAELKLQLAWLADSAAWEPARLAALAEPMADELLLKLRMHDMWDWTAPLAAYRALELPPL